MLNGVASNTVFKKNSGKKQRGMLTLMLKPDRCGEWIRKSPETLSVRFICRAEVELEECWGIWQRNWGWKHAR
jgi:hypothetical protein